MKITVDKKSLVPIQQMVAIANNKSPLPILANFLITAHDQEIAIITTDLEVGARLSISAVTAIGEETISANIEEPGFVCVNAQKFAEIIRLLDADAIVSITGTDRNVKISDFGGKTNYQLPVMSHDDFPVFASFEGLEWKELSTSSTIKHLFRVMFAAANDTSRYNLNGLCFDVYKGKPCIVATDGHRLALQYVDDYPFGDTRILMPKSTAEFIKKTLIGSKQSVFKIAYDTKNIYLSVGNMQVSCRLLDGDFPDFTKVIADTETSSTFSINKDSLLAAVRRVSLVTMDRSRGITMAIGDNAVKLAANTEIGSSLDIVPVEYESTPFELIINSDYMTDAIAALNGDVIKFYYAGEGKPLTIENDGSDDYFNLVMPMRK